MSELRELTKEELEQKLNDLKEEMFNLRFQKSLNRLENQMRLKIVKKDIARLLTLMTERQQSEIKA
jgi:large subunit ribosomal protein L29